MAAIRIGGTNETAIKELEGALAFQQNGWVRGAVARGIGQLGLHAELFLPALRRNLNDDYPDARRSAAEAIAKIERLRDTEP